MTDFVDLYHGDGGVDWRQARAVGIEGAWIKATEAADYTDPAYHANVAGARAAGIVPGPYLFMRPGSGALQEQHFEAIAGMDVLPGRLRGVLDIEDGGITAGTVEDCIRAYVAHHGHGPTLYASRSFFDERGWLTALAVRYGCPLWVAAYGANRPHYGSAWQYTSTGRLPGTPHDLDLSHVYDVGALMVPGPIPIPVPPPPPAPPVNGPVQHFEETAVNRQWIEIPINVAGEGWGPFDGTFVSATPQGSFPDRDGRLYPPASVSVQDDPGHDGGPGYELTIHAPGWAGQNLPVLVVTA